MLRNSGSGSVLPTGYRKVHCITIPEGGYIDTGLVVVEGDVIKTIARIDSSLQLNSINTIYSSYGGAGNMCVLAFERGARPYFQYNPRYSYIGALDNGKHNYELNTAENYCKMDDETVALSCSGDTSVSIVLSARKNSNNRFDRKTECTFWAHEVSNGGVSKQTLIPCEQLSNNEFGLFDLVSQTFLGNIGTGVITEGVE